MKGQYCAVVGDPCYRYNKQAKENFFTNPFLAFMFVQFVYYHGMHFIEKIIHSGANFHENNGPSLIMASHKRVVFYEII
jgi:hypothetical protein